MLLSSTPPRKSSAVYQYSVLKLGNDAVMFQFSPVLLPSALVAGGPDIHKPEGLLHSDTQATSGESASLSLCCIHTCWLPGRQ